MISQRVASINETQVGNPSPLVCRPANVRVNAASAVPAGYIQEIERIYLEEDCCAPQPCVG